MDSPASRFRKAIRDSAPLQCPGVINAYCAKLAERAGHKALYLSGAGIANASHALPDLGITTLADVVEDARRITSATALPVLCDIDTGFGGAFNIARAIRELERAGVAAVHIEDQVSQKRCGHRPNKQIVPTREMVDRIRAAVDARTDIQIMARTDAVASEGMDAAIERCRAYLDAGADMLFPEALTALDHYAAFRTAFPDVPILANMTEFGKTPLFARDDLHQAGVSIVIYPLTAFRAMSKVADDVYRLLLDDGSQVRAVDRMQTRQQLYDVIGYHGYENKLDELFGAESS